MISHLIISIKCFKLNIFFIKVFIETGLFIVLHPHWWIRIGNIYLGSFEIALSIYISLTSWLSPHSSFHYVHLRFTYFFERMLNLCVYTYKPWGFVYSSLSDSYFPKIMYYKTYVSCIYIPRSWFLIKVDYIICWIFYSRMTYVSYKYDKISISI